MQYLDKLADIEQRFEDLTRQMADPEIIKAWAASGMEPYPKDLQTPAGAAKYLHGEIERWGQVVRDNKIEAPAN